MQIEPSAVAVAAITAAVRGLYVSEWRSVLSTLATAVSLDAHALLPVVDQIDLVVESESEVLPPSVRNQQLQQPSTPTNKHQSTAPMEFFDGNETPKDLTDVVNGVLDV